MGHSVYGVADRQFLRSGIHAEQHRVGDSSPLSVQSDRADRSQAVELEQLHDGLDISYVGREENIARTIAMYVYVLYCMYVLR